MLLAKKVKNVDFLMFPWGTLKASLRMQWESG